MGPTGCVSVRMPGPLRALVTSPASVNVASYIGHGTQLLHLRDTNDDRAADERTVLFRGFGTGDSHQNINSFLWGPGGELWMCQGLSVRSRVETPWERAIPEPPLFDGSELDEYKETYGKSLVCGTGWIGGHAVGEIGHRAGAELDLGLDVDPLPYREQRLTTGLPDENGGRGIVHALHIDAESALLEYLAMYYRLGRAGKALDRFGVIEFATTIAPGVRDVLLTGKVYEAANRNARNKGARHYDAIVLDAPPTGRITQFLNVNDELAGLAKVGPIKGQSEGVVKLLHSGDTAVHLVALLEEMPVQETKDAIAELGRLSLRVGSVIANGVRRPLVGDEHATAVADEAPEVRDALGEALGAVDVKAGPAMVSGLLREGADHVLRARLQVEQRQVLAELPVPVRTLPHLADGVESGDLRLLADTLAEQGGV